MSPLSFLQNHPIQRLTRWARSVLFYGHWMIGVIDQPIQNALTWTQAPPIRWIEATPNRRRYLADPFPWPGSHDTLVAEAYDVPSQTGHLVALKLDGEGLVDEIKISLPLPGHLSYPFLFMKEGTVFMMPESGASGKLEIFRWQEEDGQWVLFASILIGRPVADATLFEKDGLFWISFTDISTDPHNNLYLIYARTLAGPWLPHAANPVRLGKENSRNAGAVFQVEGRYYRPAQDCSRIYGGSLRIMEITSCTPNSYAEQEVTHITPSSRAYPDGLHTLSAWGDKCLVDGMRLTFSPRLLAKKVWRRVMPRK